jgi:hypothetical protein
MSGATGQRHYPLTHGCTRAALLGRDDTPQPRGIRSSRGIAAELVVSERTVGHHLAHVYDKTGRRTRAGAAVFAMEHGLVPG